MNSVKTTESKSIGADLGRTGGGLAAFLDGIDDSFEVALVLV